MTRATPAGRSLEAGVAACFALSGFAALVYQTAWLRQLALVFGTSELATAAVLAAYMGGLAAGAAAAGRWVGRVSRPVLVYGLLEAGIAVSALAVPWALDRAAALQAAWLGGRPAPPDAAGVAQPLLQLAAAFAVLCVPTALMGATLPLLARHAVRGDRELLPRIALLYAVNTGGAVVGTLATGFVLLPSLGLHGAVSVGVATNLLVLAIAVGLARRAPAVPVLGADAPPAPDPAGRAGWILPLALAAGAVAFGYEVLWTRLLTHLLGGSVQAFATMLAAFLTGIALGGASAGGLARDRASAVRAFGLAQAGAAALSLVAFALLGRALPETRSATLLAAYAFALLLPATVCIGASFPLAVRVLAADARDAGPASARVYAWNTTGAIAGALAAGFVVIPGLGFEGAARWIACAGLAIAAAALVLGTRSRAPAAALGAALVLVAIAVHPGRPDALVARAGIARARLADPVEVFYAVGRTATVLVLESDGAFYLRGNGLPEATIASRGAPPAAQPEAWLAALPLVARPDARSLLVIGLGGGVSVAAVPPGVDAVDVIEIEPEMIAANRAIAARRDADPLADPRVRIAVNDARNALARTSARWDAIVSQPSHPWTAGASQLYTRELAALARRHLRPSGVFAQWVNAELVTTPLLRSVLATLRAEFAHVRAYRPSPAVLILLASDAPIAPELSLARTGRPLSDAPAHFGRLGIHAIEDLVAALALDDAGVAAVAEDAAPVTDDRNPLATGSRTRADGIAPEALDALLLPHDPLLDPAGEIHARIGYALDPAYLAARLLGSGQSERARRLAEILPDPADAATARGVLAQARGDPDAARRAFRDALAADPGHQGARYLLLRSAGLHRLAAADLDPEVEDLLGGLRGSALAVAVGWPHWLANDFDTLARLDAALALARPTDAWYPEAVRLRAEWRLRAAEDRAALAAEARALIEQALPHFPDRDLLLLRAASAIAMEDADALVGSARLVLADVEGELAGAATAGVALPPHERELLRHNLAALAEQLDAPGFRDHAHSPSLLARARSVLAEVGGDGAPAASAVDLRGGVVHSRPPQRSAKPSESTGVAGPP